jgi:hypothetical protein
MVGLEGRGGGRSGPAAAHGGFQLRCAKRARVETKRRAKRGRRAYLPHDEASSLAGGGAEVAVRRRGELRATAMAGENCG